MKVSIIYNLGRSFKRFLLINLVSRFHVTGKVSDIEIDEKFSCFNIRRWAEIAYNCT